MLRSRVLLVLALFLLAPFAAHAGKPKSPYYALVRADGTLAFGSGLQTFRQQTGVYWVYSEPVARPDLLGCVPVGTSAGGFVGTVSFQPGDSDVAFRVTTTLGAGIGSYDMPFYIVVHCPKWRSGG